MSLDYDQIKSLVDYISDSRRAIYSWQKFLLWQLFTFKEVRNRKLIDHACHVVRSDAFCEADKGGASLYLGSLGVNEYREELIRNFKNCGGYLQQRLTLLGIHEAKWSPAVHDEIAPYLDVDLFGVLKTLKNQKNKGVYCKKPELVEFKSLYKEGGDYEY